MQCILGPLLGYAIAELSFFEQPWKPAKPYFCSVREFRRFDKYGRPSAYNRDVTRPQPHEAEAEAEATTHEAEAEAEATTHEAEAEAEATTHEAEAEAEAKTPSIEILIIITVSN